ncbi:MAG: branched-chain amino acid ABC transporter permease [Candidatus Lambdaproteobacteria bacterium]|nr:branched-chain amino acid ABC transporter permease [Candidatus Lambdaproteobacteria bacterium]
MELFVTQLANGLVIGMTYALVAIGLTLIYGIFHIINMTQGSLYMLGAYAAYVFVSGAQGNYFVAIVFAMVAVGLVGLLFERLSVRPLLGRNHLVFILSTFGLAVITDNLVMIGFGPEPLRLASPIARKFINVQDVLFLTQQKVFLIVFGVAMIVLLTQFLKRTNVGRGMRAVATDQNTAALMGINVKQIYRVTFFLGAAMSAAAGALVGAVFSIEPEMGNLLIIKSFAVVIMGGMGSVPGAFLGGLILGVSESLGGAYLTVEYKDAFGLIVMILVLLLRPQGLLGRRMGLR